MKTKKANLRRVDADVMCKTLPCPFCGEQPEIRTRKTTIIECKGCKALFIRMTKEAAIEAWNKRQYSIRKKTLIVFAEWIKEGKDPLKFPVGLYTLAIEKEAIRWGKKELARIYGNT